MILVTDLGHDPDDVIALSYLIEHGIIPEKICVSPGFPDQVKAVNGILKSYNVTSEVIRCSDKESVNYNPGKHSILFGSSESVGMRNIKTDECLIIGPALNIGNNLECETMFFQGGFSPNSIVPLEKFSGLQFVQSHNPCGAKNDFNILLKKVNRKYFIGKNVCHGFLKKNMEWLPSNILIKKFLDKLSPDKAMHDVLAAMCFVDRNFGVWERSIPIWSGNKLSTVQTLEESYSLIGL